MSFDVDVLFCFFKLQHPFLLIGCKWFKDAELPRLNILLLITEFPGVTHLIDLKKMNELVDHKTT